MSNSRPCRLIDVRAPSGTWNFAGCTGVDLSVEGNPHWSEPFHKPRGLTAKDCALLAPALANATGLRSLRIPGLAGLHHTWEQPGVGADGMRILADALPASIEVLILTGHNFGDAGTAALAGALTARLRRVHMLNLELNGISDAGASALAKALQTAPLLATLHLDHNWIGAAGGEALAAALQHGGAAALRHLALAGNNIGERGATALAAALQSNRALQTLNLYSNHIGTSGALALARVLGSPGAAPLMDVSLAYNYIDADGESAGARALTAALRHAGTGPASTLRRLDLRWNHFALCRCGARGRLHRVAAAHQPAVELLLERGSPSG